MQAKKTIAVIGGGPGGYVAAIRAAQLGADVHIFEKERFGGTCLNVGCIPTKVLIHTAESYRSLALEAKHGLIVEKARVDWTALTRHKQAIVDRLVQGVGALLKANGVTVHTGKAVLKQGKNVGMEGKESIRADAVILATGSLPVTIPFSGYDLPDVMDSTAALSLAELPESIVIMGGGVIGVEFAYLFNALGVNVTVVEMLPRILPPVDGEISALLHKELEAQGITFLTSARIESAYKGSGKLTVTVDSKGKRTLSCDKLLVAVGRKPNTVGMGLEDAGICLERGAVVVNEQFRANVDGIYAIGDCNAKIMLAHAASAQGIAAVEHALGHGGEYHGNTVPSCIYTFPEVAGVGMTEEQAKAEGIEYTVGRVPLGAIGKALIEGCEGGLVKVIVGKKYGEILGVHMLGSRATDMIAEAALAIGSELTVDDIAATIHPHPTMSEALMEASHDALGGAIHWPPKRRKI